MSEITLVSYSVTRGEHERSLTVVFSDGTVRTASSSQPNYAVVEDLLSDDNSSAIDILDALDVANGIVRSFSRLTDKVAFNGRTLTYEGDEIRSTLVDYIIRLMQQLSAAKGSGDIAKVVQLEATTGGFLKFFESLMSNPNPASRDSLYNFIDRYGLTIMPDGRFVAYKGVDEDLQSVRSGFGVVNGVESNGHLDNSPGNVLSMPRSDVDSNANVGCAVGLHAGALDYARNWGPRVIAVAISANAVVSVPNDSEYMKLRTWSYEVLFEVDPNVETRATRTADRAAVAWTETEAEAAERKAGQARVAAEALRTSPADVRVDETRDTSAKSVLSALRDAQANRSSGYLELYVGADDTKLVEFARVTSVGNSRVSFAERSGNIRTERLGRIVDVTVS